MGVEATNTAVNAGGENEQGAQGGYTPPASQADFDRIVQTRIERERAKFADYEDLKAAAGRVQDLEKANGDLSARVQAFEAAEARQALVAKVAGAVGVSASVVSLLAGEDEAALTAAAEAVKSATAPGPVVYSQDPPETKVSAETEALRNLFGTN